MTEKILGHPKYTTYLFSLGVLFLIFLYFVLNWEKNDATQKKLQALFQGADKISLRIKYSDQKNYTFDLPSSDFIDRSGNREVNFRYLQIDAWNELKDKVSRAEFFINKVKVDDVRVDVWNKAIAVTLPKKKLYILAPPHMAMFAKAIMYEKSDERDIFTCIDHEDFCDSVKIVDFGGMTRINEGLHEQDAFFGVYILPRGRWVGGGPLKMKITSNKKRNINIRFAMESQIKAQQVVLLSPKNAQVTVQTLGPITTNNSLGVPMNRLSVDLNVTLNKGGNIISILFLKVAQKTLTLPFSTAGVVKKIIISDGN